MKNTKYHNNLSQGLASIALALVILLLPLIIVAKSFPIYQWQFSVNKTYEEFGSKDLVEEKGKEIIKYLNGKIASLDNQFFSEQARLHMYDVQQLFLIAKISTVLLALLFLVFLWWNLLQQNNASISSVLIYGGVGASIVMGFACIGVLFFWDVFFVKFHTTFFMNDLWLFPASDSLVRLFPEQFFVMLSSLAIGGSLLASGFSILSGLLLKIRYTISTH